MNQRRMQTARRLKRFCKHCGRELIPVELACNNEKWTYYQGNAAEKCSTCHNKVVLK
jgi:hypothetical protein